MDDMELAVSPGNMSYVDMIENERELHDGEAFPIEYEEALNKLWADDNVKRALERGNEAALPEKYVCSSLFPHR